MGAKLLACAIFILLSWQLVMADNNRIVFPDEVKAMKAKVVGETARTKIINKEGSIVGVETRNMIYVPENCPDGQSVDGEGICRDIF